MEGEQVQNQDTLSHSQQQSPLFPAETSKINGFPMMPVYQFGFGSSGVISVQGGNGNPMEELTLGQGNVEKHNVPNKVSTVSDIITPSSSSSAVDPPTLSLGLSFSSDQRQTSSRHSALHAMQCFSNGDSIISVA